MFLPFRLSPWIDTDRLPLKLYSIGVHAQPYQSRPSGYSTWQCFITIGGAGVFHFMDGRKLTLETNHMLILPGGLAHEYYPISDHPWHLGYIGFDGDATRSIVSGCALPIRAVAAIQNSQNVNEQLKNIWGYVDNSDPKMASLISIKLYEFLLQMSALTECSAASLPSQPTRLPDTALQRSIGYINEHFTENIVMSNLANVVGYSVQHFQRLFRETYGISPHAYLQRTRMQQAAMWLEENKSASIKEISGRLGMEPNYFIRVFKKSHGISPAEYRDHV